MDVVVDASVAFKWFVVEDDSDAALALLRNHDVVAPDLLLVECRNAALTNLRRGELSIEEAKQAERDLDAMQVRTLPSLPFLTQAFAIALELGHPIYDCVYLAAAIATDRVLVTADVRFAAKVASSEAGRSRVDLLSNIRA